eukprot:CAMPEP_0203830296 /NCGR_PEP_ID=MMETSP0115-20131106/65674_1 /ASSEMBLY_ACC=CAM_ASM_000227 /TAXON_ID=33651 /ORGANISM="Bicosoecid sp, Strain ms1" /LENGTH=65 /DNA_ID=CAMNT_0050739359 /DNA_START=5 /DNA_END=199 /DNA_ORIENTATION=+
MSCAACGAVKDRGQFSKAQRRKADSVRRCSACVNKNAPPAAHGRADGRVADADAGGGAGGAGVGG